jgi:phosphatidylglycerophosphatase A
MPATAPTSTPPFDEDSQPLGLAVWLATGGGVGFVRFAPGTFGSLLGLPLAWALSLLPWWGYLAATVAVILLGVPICGAAARRLGREDPGAVVWDEIAAMPLTFAATDLQRSPGSLALVLALGFALFRLFDILKPPPTRWLEHLPGGWGIIADDLMAGAYAGLCLYGLVWLLGC